MAVPRAESRSGWPIDLLFELWQAVDDRVELDRPFMNKIARTGMPTAALIEE
jgi:hypothetical protein